MQEGIQSNAKEYYVVNPTEYWLYETIIIICHGVLNVFH